MEEKNNYAVLVLNVTRVPYPNEKESSLEKITGEINRILHKKAENGGFLFDTEEEAAAFNAEVTEFAKTLYELKLKSKTDV